MARPRLHALFIVLLFVSCREDRTVLAPIGRYDVFKVAAAADDACPACIVGPVKFTRQANRPVSEQLNFGADPSADYVIAISDGGTQGANAEVFLNGTVIVAPQDFTGDGQGRVRKAVHLETHNRLVVRLTGKPGSHVEVSILAGTRIVDARGGIVRGEGGISVDVPAGALPDTVELQVLRAPLPGPVDTDVFTTGTHMVRLLPEGQQFALPVMLTIPITGEIAPGREPGLYLYVPSLDRMLRWERTRFDDAAKVIRGDISHFSFWLWAIAEPLSEIRNYTYKVAYAPSVNRSWPDERPALSVEEVQSEVGLALGAWAGHLPGITFSAGLPEEVVDIVVAFGEVEREYHGQAFVDCVFSIADRCVWGGRSPVRGFVLRDDVPWYSLNDDAASTAAGAGRQLTIYAMSLHELGHNLGLMHFRAAWCNSDGDDGCFGPPIMSPYVALSAHGPWCADLASLISVGYVGVRGSGCGTDFVKVGSSTPETLPPGTTVPLHQLPVVQVIDADGRGVAGAIVRFEADGDAVETREFVASNATGIARPTAWRLGGTVGTIYTLSATVLVEDMMGRQSGLPTNFERRQTFSIRAEVPPPAFAGSLRFGAVAPTRTPRYGTRWQEPAQVSIVDASGNVINTTMDSVVLELQDNPDGAQVTGARAAAVEGVATFPDFIIWSQSHNARYSLRAVSPTNANLAIGQSSAFLNHATAEIGVTDRTFAVADTTALTVINTTVDANLFARSVLGHPSHHQSLFVCQGCRFGDVVADNEHAYVLGEKDGKVKLWRVPITGGSATVVDEGYSSGFGAALRLINGSLYYPQLHAVQPTERVSAVISRVSTSTGSKADITLAIAEVLSFDFTVSGNAVYVAANTAGANSVTECGIYVQQMEASDATPLVTGESPGCAFPHVAAGRIFWSDALRLRSAPVVGGTAMTVASLWNPNALVNDGEFLYVFAQEPHQPRGVWRFDLATLSGRLVAFAFPGKLHVDDRSLYYLTWDGHGFPIVLRAQGKHACLASGC